MILRNDAPTFVNAPPAHAADRGGTEHAGNSATLGRARQKNRSKMDLHVRVLEVVALEEERQVAGTRDGIGHAIAVVQSGTVSALAEAGVGVGGDAFEFASNGTISVAGASSNVRVTGGSAVSRILIDQSRTSNRLGAPITRRQSAMTWASASASGSAFRTATSTDVCTAVTRANRQPVLVVHILKLEFGRDFRDRPGGFHGRPQSLVALLRGILLGLGGLERLLDDARDRLATPGGKAGGNLESAIGPDVELARLASPLAR